MLIKIKKRLSTEVIFELDKEDNTIKETVEEIKDTVEEAVKQGVDLSCADLSFTTLKGDDLHGAKLKRANLSNADLSGADLRDANLLGANLECADLTDTDLRYANLLDVNLSNANLSGADLHGANLSYALLRCANLSGANIEDAQFDDVILDNTVMPDLPMVCPETGTFIGYKKVFCTEEYNCKRQFIVKLEIPEDAKRSSSTSNKCRCSKAKVLEIKDMEFGEMVNEVTNTYMESCTYKVGEYVYPDSFDDCRWNECSNGIHFFMTEEEAINY